MRDEMHTFYEALQEIRHEQQRDREAASYERKLLALQLENALLKSERRLPPAREDNE